VGSFDIPLEYLKKIKEFIEKKCISCLYSIEREGVLSRLYLQMVCRIMPSSAAVVSKTIKTYLQWDKVETAPVGHYIFTKILCNTSLHTFIEMLGYCIKDKGQDHFECVHRNVTPEQSIILRLQKTKLF